MKIIALVVSVISFVCLLLNYSNPAAAAGWAVAMAGWTSLLFDNVSSGNS